MFLDKGFNFKVSSLLEDDEAPDSFSAHQPMMVFKRPINVVRKLVTTPRRSSLQRLSSLTNLAEVHGSLAVCIRNCRTYGVLDVLQRGLKIELRFKKIEYSKNCNKIMEYCECTTNRVKYVLSAIQDSCPYQHFSFTLNVDQCNFRNYLIIEANILFKCLSLKTTFV